MMRYFQTPDGQIFAIEEGQEHVIPKDGVEKTESEAMAIANPPPSFSEVQKRAINAIDKAADSKRKEYITDILGQPTVYERKAREVADYRTNSTKVGKYISAESTERGITLETLATEIEAKEDQWTTIDAQIEANRVAGKDKVRAATDQAGVEASRDNAVAAIEVL